MFRTRNLRGLLATFAIVAAQITTVGVAQAQISGVQLSLAAAEPLSYNHQTGGGNWNLARQNVDIRRSLEGEDFKCRDVISYLTNIALPNTSEFKALGEMTFDLNYSISMDTTGQSGAALGETVTVSINQNDTATVGNKNSAASVVSSSQSGSLFSKGAELFKTVRVNRLEAGDTVILRLDTKLHCLPGSSPTGNLQVRLQSANLVFKNGSTAVNPAEQLNVGDQTISLKNVQLLVAPALSISKTVTMNTGTCPGLESILIEPTQEVKFCYAVTNASTTPGIIVGPLYNVSSIYDDNGQYPDFSVVLSSGLTDVDKDGQIDDLDAGATAYGSYVVALDGAQDSVVTNIATVTGYGQPSGGLLYSASDTATVNIDAPAPDITISKLTNGSDSLTIMVGQAITWTYVVTNTGDRALFNLSVTDDKGVSVTCPSTELAIGASMMCSATGVATAGNYTNIGTVNGQYNSTSVTASDSSSYFGADPAIDIQKTPDTQTVVEGKKAAFTITVTNTGNVPLTAVAVSDPLASECAALIGALAVGAQSSFTCSSSAITGNFTNIASVVGYFGDTQVTDSDSASVQIHYLPNIEVTKTVDKSSVLETGETVTYTIQVLNKVVHDFVLTSLVDDKFGDLAGRGTCVVPQTIVGNGSYTCTVAKVLTSDLLIPHTNVVTAQGKDLLDNPASASDSATVTFTDLLPNISLDKSASAAQVSEAGGDVTFTFVVTNNSAEAVTITSLVDDKFGDLNGKGTCVAPQALAGLGTYTCSYTTRLGDWTTTPHTNTATASGEDNEGNKTSASDSATVTFTDLLPTIAVSKSVNPTIIRASGAFVDYTFVITNTGPETVTVQTMVDPLVTLSAQCLVLIGKSIPVGGSLQCVTNIFMVVPIGGSLTNTVNVTAIDNEGNSASASSSAILKSYWFGRSPGYWKNHPESWISGYLPSQFIQSIFTIPGSLLTSGNLDLDKNGAKDTLMNGLAYKGGSGLAGAAQILLRASVAALLNEAYYGADYPAETSVGAVISHVNSVLATQNRDTYLALAAEYDKWNNGVEGPLP